MDRMDRDRDLDAFFAAYREACPDPEAGPEFMPGLWRRIEARRPDAWLTLRRVAQTWALAAMALTLLIGAVLMPQFQADPLEGTYLEALAEEHSPQIADVVPGGDPL